MRQIRSMLRKPFVFFGVFTSACLASGPWAASASSEISAARLSQSAVVIVCSIPNTYALAPGTTQNRLGPTLLLRGSSRSHGTPSASASRLTHLLLVW